MEKLFENNLIMDNSKIDLLPLIMEELKAISSSLIRFIFERGFKI